MRILAVAECYPPVLGSDRRITELLRRLGPSFEVTLLVAPLLRESSGHTGPRDGFTVIQLPGPVSPTLATAPGRFIIHLLRSLARRPAAGCDVVIANYPSVTTGVIAFVLACVASKPFVVDFNDLIAQYAADLLGLKDRWLLGILYRVQSFLLGKADAIVIVTQGLGSYLPVSAQRRPIAVIPNGVDTSRFVVQGNPRPRTDSFRLLYAGRYEPWAGSSLLEKLGHEIARRKWNAEICVAGSGGPGRPIPRLTFLGALPHEHIPALLSGADAVLVPFPAGPTSDAASPLKLFEAWAAGRPTLASDVAGVREVARDGEDTLLLPPDDPNAWADALGRLMADPDLRTRLGRAAREAALRSTWDRRAEAFADVLRRVAS